MCPRVSHRARAARAVLLAVSVMASVAHGAAADAGAKTSLVAVTDSGALIAFEAANPGQTREVRLSGLSGQLVGVDVRPADEGPAPQRSR